MKIGDLTKILLFLMAMAIAAMDLEPKPAALAFNHLNVSLVPGAIEVLQSRGLWTPSTAALNGLEPMFGDNFNGTLENEKFEESDLDINGLIHLSVSDNSRPTTDFGISGNENGLANVDVCSPYPSCCEWCHKCEGGCAALIIFFIFPFLACLGACRAQEFCHGCD